MSAATQTGKGKAVRILLVDDHPVVRDGLAEAINREPDLKVCAVAEDRTGALQAVQDTQPNLAVIDLTLKDSSGLELIKDLQVRWPALLLLVVSMHEENLYAERVLRAGARGYMTKQQATRDIVSAIRRVMAGGVYLNEATASAVLSRLTSKTPAVGGSPLDCLTDRELQVFELTGTGLNTREIATRLRIDMKTVETYRTRIKEKLGLTTSSQLLQMAIQWGRKG
jgi:DNA-binding NarL/FixJ family response regulator